MIARKSHVMSFQRFPIPIDNRLKLTYNRDSIHITSPVKYFCNNVTLINTSLITAIVDLMDHTLEQSAVINSAWNIRCGPRSRRVLSSISLNRVSHCSTDVAAISVNAQLFSPVNQHTDICTHTDTDIIIYTDLLVCTNNLPQETLLDVVYVTYLREHNWSEWVRWCVLQDARYKRHRDVEYNSWDILSGQITPDHHQQH